MKNIPTSYYIRNHYGPKPRSLSSHSCCLSAEIPIKNVFNLMQSQQYQQLQNKYEQQIVSHARVSELIHWSIAAYRWWSCCWNYGSVSPSLEYECHFLMPIPIPPGNQWVTDVCQLSTWSPDWSRSRCLRWSHSWPWALTENIWY